MLRNHGELHADIIWKQMTDSNTVVRTVDNTENNIVLTTTKEDRNLLLRLQKEVGLNEIDAISLQMWIKCICWTERESLGLQASASAHTLIYSMPLHRKTGVFENVSTSRNSDMWTLFLHQFPCYKRRHLPIWAHVPLCPTIQRNAHSTNNNSSKSNE